eukprot:1392249-Rhodomonas_salina.1
MNSDGGRFAACLSAECPAFAFDATDASRESSRLLSDSSFSYSRVSSSPPALVICSLLSCCPSEPFSPRYPACPAPRAAVIESNASQGIDASSASLSAALAVASASLASLIDRNADHSTSRASHA